MALLPGNCGVDKLFKRNAMPFSGLSLKQPSSFLRLRSLPVACLPPPTRTRNNKLFVTSSLAAIFRSEMLRPIPVALASCTRYFEAISAMRESIAALHRLRVGSSSPVTPSKDPSWMSDQGDSECATPPPWNANYSMDEPNSDDVVIRSRTRLDQLESSVEDPDFGASSDAGQSDHDGLKQRRLSWPPSSATHNMV